jgi:FAD dependent oxidoreductase TIGR03364
MKSDVIVVGSGIVGMACAWAALEQGLSVQVVDRDPVCVGASIRNFGFVTVTGQGRGDTWRRARRSRDVWTKIAPEADIAIEHTGLYVQAQRLEAKTLLQELLEQPEGKDLQWFEGKELRDRAPLLAQAYMLGALYSPYELRIESRTAIEKLRQWLASRGVVFHMGQAVTQVVTGAVQTSQGWLQAHRIAVCPGPDIRSLFPDIFRQRRTRLCQLQMLRVQPPNGYRLPAAVMSDLSLARYTGYTELPSAQKLLARLGEDSLPELQQGIHLIVVQSHDGSLVVGDSHVYGEALTPFTSEEVDRRILQEMQRMLCLGHYQVTERWTGIYPSGPKDAFFETVLPGVQLISVTSGTGMSTSFGLAEDWVRSWEDPA